MLDTIQIHNFKCLKGSHSLDFNEGIYSIKAKKDGDFVEAIVQEKHPCWKL